MKNHLSPQQEKILEYMCQGYSNREIADALGNKEQTIKNQFVLSCLMHAKNRTHAVAIALGQGMTRRGETGS